MCSPSPPPAPDYAAAARAQGAANVDAAVAQGHINNPNVVNPYGTQTVTWNGNDPTLTQTLSPNQQQILNESEQNRMSLGQLAETGINNAQGVVGSTFDTNSMPGPGQAFSPGSAPNPLDSSKLPPMPAASQTIRDQVVNAMLSRSNSDIDAQQTQKQSDLIAAGIRPGTDAYAREMNAFSRQRNDAEQQAILAGNQAAQQQYAMDLSTRQQAEGEQAQQFQQGGQAAQLRQGQQAQQYQQMQDLRRQAISEALTRRELPLNEITALMSGSQVSNPFAMPGYAQNANVQPAPIFGATQALSNYNTDMYNSQVASNNALMNGLFGVGAAFAGGPRPSDRRLKSNIRRIGTHPLGIGIYEYDIFGHHEIGVMAQEVLTVKPDAVIDGPFLMVNYARL